MTCQNLSGDLPIIRSEDENNFIRDLVGKQQTVQGWGAWLGLYRKADTKFYWINEAPLQGQYSAWASGEPNNRLEKCAHTFNEFNRVGKWNDNKCELSKSQRWTAPVILCQKNSI